ncbi:ABC transporter permease [Kaistia dalseonensis]|uniref:Ribose transport system permease protein n=1 Tax=Kaistia dalseonensis TaxID=410840 RepID=A0ABU0H0X0_9HYPH|nr:ABC transporter permease [Kaistia dalseonensis]MCX5493390.1 ABC transporter permease [Kaistia dalseonensis]MDQ0435948.1 ribose transport system permease protein [Kaistia dalseonensis]
MTATTLAAPARRRLPLQLIGGWEVGLIVFMVLLYIAGVFINPKFFGQTDAFSAILRDTARYGVMAAGMTFVIINKDLDLSVGSTLGLVATVFSICFSKSYYDLGIGPSVIAAVLVGLGVGLVNGFFVTVLRVPSFITTLTMLFIGRGFVLGLTGGKTISYSEKALEAPWFFQIGETNALGFNNQILIFLAVTIVGMIVLAKTRWGYETYATGGNEMASIYAGIPTRRVRMRGYVLSALCATLAGLMNVAQDKGITSQYGQGAELIVIAAVIVGGASILGGRGRLLGGALGAILVVLIDKVLREGIPMTRTVKVGGVDMQVQGMAQLPPGAVPAFLGLILLIAVLIEPWIIRRNVFPRLWARLTGRPLPPIIEVGGVAIEGAQTKGSSASDSAMRARGPIGHFLARRDAAAIVLAILLWCVGLYLRPDFWGSIDNSFNLMLSFTEVGLLSIGMTYVIANGDIDLSVGSVLALSAATCAFLMKQMGFDPWTAVFIALMAGAAAGLVNALLTVGFGLPAFVATLGMFYMARGIGAWMTAGRQLSSFSETFNLLGRKLIDALTYFGIAPARGTLVYDIAAALSVQTIFMIVVAILAGIVLAKTPFGQMVYATGGNRRAAEYAGINSGRVRAISLVFSALCAACAGVIYVAFLRSFNPSAGQLRELDAIAAVIIGGGSIFGGYGTVLGALAGAAVIALIRALLSLQLILSNGQSFVMPQHWVNVFIGLILIVAVVGDIWLRQGDLAGTIRRRFFSRRAPAHGAARHV